MLEQLQQERLPAFLPCVDVWSRRRGVRRLITAPMFPSDLFVQHPMDKDTYLAVSRARGLVRVRIADSDRRRRGRGSQSLVIGTVGRLSAIKGHVHLLRAGRQVLDRQRWARFLFIGGGPLRNELLITAAELQLAAACALPGARRDLYDVMSAMDIFALPARTMGARAHGRRSKTRSHTSGAGLRCSAYVRAWHRHRNAA